MGYLKGEAARETLDATGLVVVPGFIDIHSHSDLTLHEHPRAESRIRQGITTEVVGNPIVARWGMDPVEAVLCLLEVSRSHVSQVTFSMSEEDVRTVLRHPAVIVGSDGLALAPRAGGKPHPRSYGTFAGVLGRYVRQPPVRALILCRGPHHARPQRPKGSNGNSLLDQALTREASPVPRG